MQILRSRTGYPWSLEGFATDLSRLMDHLGVDKAHLIGETIGGTIARQFAYQFPDRLHTVTTCTSPYKFHGIQAYRVYYDLVKARGVEVWVRQTAHRRLERRTFPLEGARRRTSCSARTRW